jgi:hypothetical protein
MRHFKTAHVRELARVLGRDGEGEGEEEGGREGRESTASKLRLPFRYSFHSTPLANVAHAWFHLHVNTCFG